MCHGVKQSFERLTGGPWGTLAQVEACLKAIELFGAAARATAFLLATLTVESILAQGWVLGESVSGLSEKESLAISENESSLNYGKFSALLGWLGPKNPSQRSRI
jgi:hypothetical protein